ncbi:DUF349 domain-containing protein [Thalassotalea ganghwensis]
MIFSNLFKEKWQSKQAPVRLQAIAEDLNIERAEDRAKLKTLSSSDSDINVRKAALLKLDSFESWYEAYQNNDSADIRQLAEKKVEDIVLGRTNILLSVEDKFAYLDTKPKSTLLEQWLLVETNDNLLITLFETLAKPQIIPKLFEQHPNSALLDYIVDQTDDFALIEKLVKKTKNNKVKTKLETKLEQLKEAIEKPKKLAKQVQLTLSKYLALKDETDYQTVLDKRKDLEQEWQTQQEHFAVFDEEIQQQYLNKWHDIERQLTSIFAQKAELFEQQKIAKQLKQDQVKQLKVFEEAITEINQQLSTAIFENNAIDKDSVANGISKKIAEIAQSLLSDDDKERLKKAFLSELAKLEQLDEIAESVAKATHLISRMSQFSVPNNQETFVEKYPTYQLWKEDWQKIVKQSINMLPQSILDAHSSICQAWDKEASVHLKNLEREFKATRKKLFDVKRLIDNGKFNPAFGVFKQAKLRYQSLLPSHQQQLSKELENCQEKIDEIADWEHYVATPKKQELLEKVQKIVQQPLDSPLEQADAVKQFRKQWNSLGHADDEVEAQLNQAFNEACENAFAPCRTFFAEQEQLRAKNLQQRKELISELTRFVEINTANDLDFKKLESSINKFNQRWRNCKEVDKKHYQTLNKSFSTLIKPLKTLLKQHHEDNAKRKQLIINKTKEIVANSEAFDAANAIKPLQAEWKTIGYAGTKVEHALWHEFKSLTDSVFNNRQQVIEEQKEKEQGELKRLKENVEQVAQLMSDDITLEQITDGEQQLNRIASEIKNLNLNTHAEVDKINKELKTLKAIKTKKLKQQANKQWQIFFSILEENIKQDQSYSQCQGFEQLDNNTKKILCSIEEMPEAEHQTRLEKTIAVEVLAEQKFADEDPNLIMKVQVELMQSQLEIGSKLSIELALEQWLKVGKFSESDDVLIHRVKQVLLG